LLPEDSVLIRKTKSICPICLQSIEAFLIEENKEIFLLKECSAHGEFRIRLSKEASFYKELDRFYFSTMEGAKPLLEYELWPTLKCNMECKICCFGKNLKRFKGANPSVEDIERFIKRRNDSFYILSGGEPTCREDLESIILMLKQNGKAVTINTNGLKLINKDYLMHLRKAGLDRVNLQFDGFKEKSYQVLRGNNLLETKKKILSNLRESGTQTTINAVIARTVNDDDLMNLVNYAVNNDFINGINFFTLCYLGEVRSWPLDYYIMPDEVIDIICCASKNKISRAGIFRFQKLHLAVKSFLKQRYCFYNQVYLLVRGKGTYEPIENFLNLPLAEKWLDRYQSVAKSNRYAAVVFLGMAFLCLFVSRKAIVIFKELLFMSFSYFFKTSNYLKNRRFLSLSFSTGCDPYKFDEAIVKNCQNEIIGQNAEGTLEHLGREGEFCINFERLCMNSFKEHV